LGLDPAFAGRAASTPVAHTPPVSDKSKPSVFPAVSVYQPTALQFPAEAHDTAGRLTFGLDPAFAGKIASTPCPQVPPVSVSRRPCWWPALSV
jgi:hypothetical protein